MVFPIGKNISPQPRKYFGKIKKRPPPWDPTRCHQVMHFWGTYFRPATKIFSAIEKSILRELNFENGFTHRQKYFCPATKIFWENQKATTPSGTQLVVTRGEVAF